MLGVELKVHSLAQDGVLLLRWSLFCFLLQLHPLSAAFVPPGAESANARRASAWAHGPFGGRPSLGTGSEELSAGPGGPLVASVGQGGASLAASWGQGPWPSVQASGQNPTEVHLISVLTRGARPRAGGRGCLRPRPRWVQTAQLPLRGPSCSPQCASAPKPPSEDACQLGLGLPRQRHSDSIASSRSHAAGWEGRPTTLFRGAWSSP